MIAIGCAARSSHLVGFNDDKEEQVVWLLIAHKLLGPLKELQHGHRHHQAVLYSTLC